MLFRLFHDGAEADRLHLPPRHGDLFKPDRFPFLEGRRVGGARQIHERIEPPLVPDGTVYRALDKLLVLDGERISYRALDVEQIGSVYGTMMGFRLETAHGRLAAIRAAKGHDAPATVNLEALLAEPSGSRAKWLRADFGVHNHEGLTKTYNRFHDPHEYAADVVTLRNLHTAMDTAVLAAYAWDDIPTDCDFLPDHSVAEEGAARGRKRYRYRYRWPDKVRDEVLARLLELNAQRAAEEARSGKAAIAARRKTEQPSAWTSERRAGAARAAESRPLWGASDD